MSNRKTPIMGWSSWNCFRTDVNEQKMKKQADALVETGLAACGYTYFNMDDGFFGGRDETGRLQFHRERFPNGIRVIAEYAHSKGLKAGIYAEGGDRTCGYFYDNEGDNGFGAGLYRHEEADLHMLLEDFGFDFIKVDWCGGVRMGLDEQEQYTKIARIIDDIRKKTGRQIVFNICRWRFPGEWAVELADSWRTGADITPDFRSVLQQIDNIKCLARYCQPGHVNDLDMMQVGNGLTETEEKTHFIMWCMMSTPLMIGCDLTKMQKSTLELLKNKELIAINQDAACRQAYVIKEYRGRDNTLTGEIWYKVLHGDTGAKRAVAFLNRSEAPVTMRLSVAEAGFGDGKCDIWDVWRQAPAGGTETIEITVQPHDTELFFISGEHCAEVPDLNRGLQFQGDWDPNAISAQQVHELVKNGAHLIDVRSPQEFQKGHLPHAVNIPHTSVFDRIGSIAGDRQHDHIILYCTTGKRCAQAKLSLEYLYYEHLYTYRWDGVSAMED